MPLRKTCAGRPPCPKAVRWTVSREFEQGTGGTGIALKLACIILARALTIIILDLIFAARAPPDPTRPGKCLRSLR